MRIYFQTEAPAEEQRADTSDGNPEISVTSKAGKAFTDETIGLVGHLCQAGPCDVFVALFFGIPFLLFFVVSLWPFLPFPLGIVLPTRADSPLVESYSPFATSAITLRRTLLAFLRSG